jgi:hypothetical protein
MDASRSSYGEGMKLNLGLLLVFLLACGGDPASAGGGLGSVSCDPDPNTGEDCRQYCDEERCNHEMDFTQVSLCQDIGGGEGICLCSCGNPGGGGGGASGSGGSGGSGGFDGVPEVSKDCNPLDPLSEADCFLYCDKVPCRGGMSFVIDSMCAAQIGGNHECECECGGS